jgi:hypothetical protein
MVIARNRLLDVALPFFSRARLIKFIEKSDAEAKSQGSSHSDTFAATPRLLSFSGITRLFPSHFRDSLRVSAILSSDLLLRPHRVSLTLPAFLRH